MLIDNITIEQIQALRITSRNFVSKNGKEYQIMIFKKRINL